MIGQSTFIKDAPHNLVHDDGCRKQSGSAMKKTRIILADDQLLIRAGVRAIIEALPSHELVSECADGHQAIAAIHQFHPDIILLDIAMPGPSGIEVARSVRQFDTRARILVLSSIDRKEIIEQAMHAGADGYLLKDLCSTNCSVPSARFCEESATSRRVFGTWKSTPRASEMLESCSLPGNWKYCAWSLQARQPRKSHAISPSAPKRLNSTAVA
jgi:CheY-like chemotaxis protein